METGSGDSHETSVFTKKNFSSAREEKEEGDKKEKHPDLKINSNHCISIQCTSTYSALMMTWHIRVPWSLEKPEQGPDKQP